MVDDSILEKAGEFLEMGDEDDSGICELALMLVVDGENVDENDDGGAGSFFRVSFLLLLLPCWGLGSSASGLFPLLSFFAFLVSFRFLCVSVACCWFPDS